MTAKKTSSPTPESATSDWITPLLQMQQNSLDPLRWLGAAWLESATEINKELAEFLSRRIQEDVRTQHELLNCSDPAKLNEIQARFIQRAVDDYSAETGTLVDLGREFMEKLARPVNG